MKVVREVEEVRSGQVRSITRALSLLRALAASIEGLTLSEAAEISKLAPSTAHRILTTLESERFVRFETSVGLWQVGVAAFTVGAAFTRNREVVTLARPFLRRLMEVTGETANIYVESSGEAVCMAQVESRHTMRAITQVGGRVKMHWSAAGKALLSCMTDAHVMQILSEHGMARATARTMLQPEGLLREIATVRQTRFAHDVEEFTEGLRCIATPIFNESGRGVAAISISGPTARITVQRIELLERTLIEVADEVMRDFGGQPPSEQKRARRTHSALL
ncbi:MAG: IclR family transcriptional regulator [Pseudomonadota bacterium]